MKGLIVAVIILFASGFVAAQITLTSATFPSINDTLKIATDGFPSGIQISPSGGPYNWNFSNLKVDALERLVYRPASEGKAFSQVPGAELYVAMGEGREAYYKKTATTFELLALSGADPIGLRLNVILKFVPPAIQQRAPLRFPANNVSSTAVSVPFSLSNVPGEILDSLKLPFPMDSVRIRFTNQRNDFVDAYGNLTIPGGTYLVLREKRTEYLNTRLDAKLPLLGWQDITDFLLVDPNFEGLGKDTLITYFFLSNSAKEAIAIVSVEGPNEIPVSVRFKYNGQLITGVQSGLEKQVIKVTPNPVLENVRFEIKNVPIGKYSLIIISPEGKIVEERVFDMPGHHVESMNLAKLPSGLYTYKLMFSNRVIEAGKLLRAGR